MPRRKWSKKRKAAARIPVHRMTARDFLTACGWTGPREVWPVPGYSMFFWGSPHSGELTDEASALQEQFEEAEAEAQG